MVKLVDALVSKASSFGSVGSNPTRATKIQTMKKANVEVFGMKYKFYTIIENFEDFLEYHKLDFGKKITVSQNAIVDRIKRNYKGHDCDIFTNISEIFAGLKNVNPLDELHHLHTTVLKNQIEDLTNGKILAINSKGGYMAIKPTDDAKIEFLNVKYTDADIKVTKYPGGNHFYSKVRNIDVVDSNGKAKWNTYKYAYEQSMKFVVELNKTNVEMGI